MRVSGVPADDVVPVEGSSEGEEESEEEEVQPEDEESEEEKPEEGQPEQKEEENVGGQAPKEGQPEEAKPAEGSQDSEEYGKPVFRRFRRKSGGIRLDNRGRLEIFPLAEGWKVVPYGASWPPEPLRYGTKPR